MAKKKSQKINCRLRKKGNGNWQRKAQQKMLTEINKQNLREGKKKRKNPKTEKNKMTTAPRNSNP